MKSLNVMWVLILLCSCKATSTGNPPTTTDLAVTASPKTPAIAKTNWLMDLFFPTAWALPVNGVGDSGGLPVFLNKVWATFKEVRFSLSGVDTDSDDLRLNGPFTVDLLSSDAKIVSNLTFTGTLDQVRWTLDKTVIMPTGAPAELFNQSLIIKAEVSGRSFTVLSDEGTNMLFQKSAFGNLEGTNLVVNFLLKEMIAKINLSTVSSGELISNSSVHPTTVSACPSIDPSANSLFRCFRQGLENDFAFGADRDGDLQVDN